VFHPAEDDSTAFVFGSTTDTLWSLHQNVVTVFYYNIREDSTRRIAAGNFSFRARVRDEARRESGFRDEGGTTRVVVNFDPQTRLYRIGGRDCPRCAEPNPPPYCTSGDSVPAGFMSGFDQTALADTSGWIRFCAGDTLPQLAHVRFYVAGHDDDRDIPIDPAGLKNVRFTAAFTYIAGGEEGDLTSLQKKFVPDPGAVRGNHHLPDGTPWRGWVDGWGDPLSFPGLCPFDFNYYASAVDENNKSDGTPDSIPFYVSGSPTIDTPPGPPLVLVLAPQCSPAFAAFCPIAAGLSFGPDTLLLVGRHVPDTAQPPVTPLGLGTNRFSVVNLVTGHDHPRDSRSEIRQDLWGRIRSWRFGFACSDCEDLALPGEGQWREDVYAQNTFDDTLRVSLFLDTLCTRFSSPSNPCGFDFKVVLPADPLGTYRFSLKGKDTSAVGQVCLQPSDLGPNPASFATSTSPYGRFTGEFTRNLVLRQLQEVRPYIHGPKVAVRSKPPRKGWWRR
jgi:hypothetical protein